MTSLHPLVREFTHGVPVVGTAANDESTPLFVAPFDGTVTAVAFVAAADITGAATNNRRLELVNKGPDGTGTTVVASIQFTNGTNAADFDATSLTLSGTAANLDVETGDVLAWNSTHVGTGITDPGGVAVVTLSRS